MKKFIKRSTSLFLAVLMCFSSLIGVTATVHAATKQDVYIIDLPRGKETNKEHWGHPAYELMNGWSTFNTDYVTVKAIGDYEGDSCYCIEPGVSLYTGDKLSKEAESFWDNYPSKYNKTIDPDTIKIFIGRIMQYGYTGKNSVDWVSTNSEKADDCANHLATQLLVWETVIGERDDNFNHVDATKSGKHNIKEIISSTHSIHISEVSKMKELSKSIRFIDKHFNTLFYIPDGSQIEVVEPDGKSKILGCQYIDEYHTKIGNETYHIHDFAELIENGNKTVSPLKKTT